MMSGSQLRLGSLDSAYDRIYNSLGELRETFHRSGRLDDSNAKLDEIAKLFATYVAFRSGEIPSFPDVDDQDIVSELEASFDKTAALAKYRDPSGTSIFGKQPALALRSEDQELARQLVHVVRTSIDDAMELRDSGLPYDLLNEAFGHFVRDNFRGNIEDAQYLTPPEVTEFMVRLLLNDIASSDDEREESDKAWIFMDPTCGVGSFLTSLYDMSAEFPWLDRNKMTLVAQDQVERMVRLTKINMELFDSTNHVVTRGDSASIGSPIDTWRGRVDAIITNPPFGARISARDLVGSAPFLASQGSDTSNVDSELVFVERALELLRPGGRLLIVLPDGVVSARGMAAKLRAHLSTTCTVRSVVELPAVTFAQAGTRTKTVVLFLQKTRPHQDAPVLMSVVNELGFRVATRKGVQIKQTEGENELPSVLDAFTANSSMPSISSPNVISEQPSCVQVPLRSVIETSWTPGHFRASRMEALASGANASEATFVRLGDLVEFVSRPSSRRPKGDDVACISVKHVLGEGFLDVHAALGYRPKTPGPLVEPGDLLLSRINPRIPRICLVPDLGRPTSCSSEFEVMRAKSGGPVTNAELAFLLQSELVQAQVQSLTSGTSSSHNRIRTSELSEVMIPIPNEGTGLHSTVRSMVRSYENAVSNISAAALALAKLSEARTDLF